jgi:hypothetical protein
MLILIRDWMALLTSDFSWQSAIQDQDLSQILCYVWDGSLQCKPRLPNFGILESFPQVWQTGNAGINKSLICSLLVSSSSSPSSFTSFHNCLKELISEGIYVTNVHEFLNVRFLPSVFLFWILGAQDFTGCIRRS